MRRRASDIKFTPAGKYDRDRGLWGWVRYTLDNCLDLDGSSVRRTLSGQFQLRSPAKRDSHEVERHYYKLLNQADHDEIERQILDHLRREGWLR